jgi:hypothetical protein
MDKNLLKKVGGVALSLGVLFATVWIVSKAWQKGQTKTTK